MPFDAHANFAVSAVATAPSPASTGTSLTVTAGDGAGFPTPPFNATVWPPGQIPSHTNAEIVRVTAIATDTLTFVRTQEGTSARLITVGDQIQAPITVKTLTDIETQVVAPSPTGNSTTDTATVLAAMQSGTPLADGNYICTAEGLNLSANVPMKLSSIHGSGSTSISFPSSLQNHTGLYCSGSPVGSVYSLAAQANLGDQTLTLSSSDATALAASPGDYLHLWSSLLWPTTVANGAVHGEIVRVQSVNTSTGVITIWGQLDDTYALADTARLRKLAMLDGSYIHGVTFINSTPLAGSNGSNMIHVEWTRNFRMRDVVCIKGDGPGIQVTCSVGADVEIKVRDLADDGANNRYGYGALAWGATRDSTFHIEAERCRHAFTTGADKFTSQYTTNPAHCGVPRHINVYGNVRETTAQGWDTHSEGDDIRFWVTADSCAEGGMGVRAKNVKVMSWSFQNCRDSNYMRWTASGLRVFPGTSRGTLTGTGAAWDVGDQGGTVLSDVKFYGMHSDSEGTYGVVVNNASDVWFIDPVITNPGSGVAFFVTGTSSNIHIVNAVTEGVTSLVGGLTSAVSVVSPGGPTPVDLGAAPYNAVGDYKTVTDASITSGTNVLNSPTAAFTANDVGKSINVAGAGASGAYLATTIAGYTSATAVTTAANAATTVSGATMSWGTNNRATIASALAINGGTTYYLPAGNYYADMTAGVFTVPEGACFQGDGWTSILTIGPEGSTNSGATVFAASGVNWRVEKMRLVGPASIGTGGKWFLFNISATAGGSLKVRDINSRLFSVTFDVAANGCTVDCANSEIEGRAAGGTGGSVVVHSGTSGELRMDNTYCWNQGLGNSSYIAVGTGINVDLHRCKFDSQIATTSNVVVSHFDTAGSAPTPCAFSRIRACWFGTGLLGPSVQTPYQGLCRIVDCDFQAPFTGINVRGEAQILNNRFTSAATGSPTFPFITSAVVSTPIASRPTVRVEGNRFEGHAGYAVYNNNDGDFQIVDNDFLGGDGTVPVLVHVRFDTSTPTTAFAEIRGNRFGGQTTNYAIDPRGGNISITDGNRFFGTFGQAALLALTGTNLLRVRRNQFDQSASVFNFVSNPTTIDIDENYGSKAPVRTPVAASYTMLAIDRTIAVTSTSAARTITQPAIAASTVGATKTVVDESNAAATNNITVACAGTDTFLGGATSKVINTNGGVLRFYANGTVWVPV